MFAVVGCSIVGAFVGLIAGAIFADIVDSGDYSFAPVIYGLAGGIAGAIAGAAVGASL
jgi:hypothetical protein